MAAITSKTTSIRASAGRLPCDTAYHFKRRRAQSGLSHINGVIETSIVDDATRRVYVVNADRKEEDADPLEGHRTGGRVQSVDAIDTALSDRGG